MVAFMAASSFAVGEQLGLSDTKQNSSHHNASTQLCDILLAAGFYLAGAPINLQLTLGHLPLGTQFNFTLIVCANGAV